MRMECGFGPQPAGRWRSWSADDGPVRGRRREERVHNRALLLSNPLGDSSSHARSGHLPLRCHASARMLHRPRLRPVSCERLARKLGTSFSPSLHKRAGRSQRAKRDTTRRRRNGTSPEAERSRTVRGAQRLGLIRARTAIVSPSKKSLDKIIQALLYPSTVCCIV